MTTSKRRTTTPERRSPDNRATAALGGSTEVVPPPTTLSNSFDPGQMPSTDVHTDADKETATDRHSTTGTHHNRPTPDDGRAHGTHVAKRRPTTLELVHSCATRRRTPSTPTTPRTRSTDDPPTPRWTEVVPLLQLSLIASSADILLQQMSARSHMRRDAHRGPTVETQPSTHPTLRHPPSPNTKPDVPGDKPSTACDL